MKKSAITGTGSYLPEKVLTNEDLALMVDTNDEWITTRTGIKQRHIAAKNELTSDMAAKAAEKAITSSGISKKDIDLIIVATTTPDRVFPATAVKVQSKLGIKQGAAFDIQAVCSGFVFALSIADNFIKSGQVKNAIVIGAEKMSCIVDWEDRATCVLFGDGAGAVVLQANDDNENKSGILSTHLYSDGDYEDILLVDGGVGVSSSSGKIKMQGKEVFKHAVENMSNAVIEGLESNNLSIEDIDVMIPHQANLRIISTLGKKLKVPAENVVVTVDKHANTSAASIPLALDYAVQNNKIKKNDIVVFEAIGGGLSWGSCIIRW